MPKYNFYGQFAGSFDLGWVEAEDEESAFDRAHEIWDGSELHITLRDKSGRLVDQYELDFDELIIDSVEEDV